MGKRSRVASKDKMVAKAARHGVLEALKFALDAGGSPSGIGTEGVDALGVAAYYGHVDCVQELIKRGALIDGLGGAHLRPLVSACMGGHFHAFKMLLDAGASLGEGDANGGVAMRAAFLRQSDCALLALERGADPFAKDAHGRTFAMEAASAGLVDVLRVLVSKGADVFAHAENGDTASALAALYGKSECFKLLLECGAADLSWRSFDGQSLHDLTQVGINGKASSTGPLLVALALSLHEKNEMERGAENAPSKKSSIRM